MEKTSREGRGALDAFLNLLTLVTLGWLSIVVGMILFQLIDKIFAGGSTAVFNEFSQVRLKFSIASAIIVTPVFLWISSVLHQQYKAGKLSPSSGIHRWLTYLMMFISALVIIGSLINIIFRFLDGDYTWRAVLRILSVLLIAAGIFGYNWYDLKRTDYSSRSKVSVTFFAAVAVLVLILVVVGFFLIDSPKVATMKKNDLERANSLNSLNYLINNYYYQNQKLPADLVSIGAVNYVDPETKELYGYEALGQDTYKLCANFSLATDSASAKEYYATYYGTANWYSHGAGYQCFEQKVSVSVNKGDQAAPVIIQ